MPDSPFSIALDDTVLETVRAVWKLVLGTEAEDQTFLRFEEKEEEAPELQD